MVDNYMDLANFIICHIGGKHNISEMTHCVSRLRFYLKDEALADTEILQQHEKIIAVLRSAGQYQLIIGSEVNEVFRAVCKAANISGSAPWYEK